MNNLITVFDEFDESEIAKLNDRQIVYIRTKNELYMKDNDKFVNLFANVWNEINQIPYRTHKPAYDKIINIDRFANGVNSFTFKNNGFVLFIIKGMGSFEFKIQDKTLLSKRGPTQIADPNNVNKNESDSDILFSQIYPISKDDTVSINILYEYPDAPLERHLFFIPLRTAGITNEHVINEKRLIDIMHPVGSLYFTTCDVNPEGEFPSTEWKRFGQGRVVVGANVDKNDPEIGQFAKKGGNNDPINTETDKGGHLNHRLKLSEIPLHTHTITQQGHHHDIENHPDHQDLRYHHHNLQGVEVQDVNYTYSTYGSSYTGTLHNLLVKSSNPEIDSVIPPLRTGLMYRGDAPNQNDEIKTDNTLENNKYSGFYPSDYSHKQEHKIDAEANITIDKNGGGMEHSIVQPYSLCYIWERTK